MSEPTIGHVGWSPDFKGQPTIGGSSDVVRILLYETLVLTTGQSADYGVVGVIRVTKPEADEVRRRVADSLARARSHYEAANVARNEGRLEDCRAERSLERAFEAELADYLAQLVRKHGTQWGEVNVP